MIRSGIKEALYHMDEINDPEIQSLIRKYALQNALEYEGKGQMGSALGRLLSERQDLRPIAKTLMPIVSSEVDLANKMIVEDGPVVVRQRIESIDPSAVKRTRQEKRKGLRPLDDTDRGVILRFAPNPNGPLSLGHSRGVVINHQYAKMYNGKMVLRYDDTDTVVKPPLVEAYDWIAEDYQWLTGSKPDVVIRASERMPQYLKFGEEMLSKGFGYVCECTSDEFKDYRISMTSCPHRSRSVDENLTQWKKMVQGTMKPGDAVVRVLTDMTLPNPALRDWPAWRIQHKPHPVIGVRYRVWPLLDFQSAIEDHLQGISHIVRGKDLMDSTRKQMLLYQHFGWVYPHTLYWGRVSIHGHGSFSTSNMREGIESEIYNGWDDVRLPTIKSLRRKGYSAEAITSFWIEMGITQKDVAIPLDSINAVNSRIIDPTSRRISLVVNPVNIEVIGELPGSVHIPYHPDRHSVGHREIPLSSRSFLVEESDLSKKFRLKDLADVEKTGDGFAFTSDERTDDRPIIHWISCDLQTTCDLVRSEGEEVFIEHCVIEDADLIVGEVVQLERKGFVRVEEWSEERRTLVWLHR